MRIIIVGKGGSGKDFLSKKLELKGYRKGISHTTRPPRENEKDSVDYFFANRQAFLDIADYNLFQEHDSFNGWHYGISNAEWDNADVFIKTPRGVSLISKEDRKYCFIIYLDIPEYIRHERLSLRNDADNVNRRLKADYDTFKDFTDYDLRITNPDF